MNEPVIRQPRSARPVALNIEVGHGRIEIRTDPSRPAAVRAEPITPNDKVALDLIARARTTDTGDRLDVRFPDPPGGSGGHGNIFVQGGSLHVSGVSIINGDVVMNGVRAGGGGLNVTAIVPPGSSVTLRTKTADATVIARRDEIPSLAFSTTSGDLNTQGVGNVEAHSISGDVEADEATGAQVNTTSGDIELTRLRGNVNIRTVSGDIDAHCLVSATIQANTVSGDVKVSSEPGVTPDVRASTVSGKTRVR